MSRYPGKPLGLTYAVQAFLDKETFGQVNACATKRGEYRAEFVRQAILFFLITECASNSIGSRVQPIDERSAL